MAGLNPAQRDAVQTLTGPMLVLAGAGTGKTRVVTTRIAELIRRGTPAERILAVTFTRKAAGEMQERAAVLLSRGKKGASRKRGKKKEPRPLISTFHSLCVKILRRHIHQLGYPEKFTICDRGDQESIARTALREIRVPDETLRPGDLLAIISNWKNQSIEPKEAASVAESDREHLAAAAYRRYQSKLKLRGTTDFDDLLLLTEQLMTKHPAIRREEAGLFDQILVDEYQDTNGSQYRIVKALAMGHRNLCVVGDDDQSIYGWRGAEVQHILRFTKDWPEAKVVRLEENYRSTGAILDYANTLIAFNSQRHDKILRPARGAGQRPQILQLQDETQEAETVITGIQLALQQPGIKAGDFAILCRTNEQPRIFETELRKAKLPYVLLGGMSFFDRKEVRDLVAYLKVVSNPTDESSMLRIINTPPRGIGASTVKSLMAAAVERGKPLWEAIPEVLSTGGLPAAAAGSVQKFQKLIQDLQELAERLPPGKLADAVVDRSNYHRELDRIYPDPNDREARRASVEELINAATNYSDGNDEATLREFLDDVAVGGDDLGDDKEKELARNAVALLTMHSAKGLEYPYVYMVGMEEGILPHRRSLEAVEASAIDEERRLCYVGVTRAQEKLTLSFALTRRKWGKPRETTPSRFLYEMTGQAENAKKSSKSTSKQRKTGKRAKP
ncbi:ATP-dependent helicase [Adhaeretor mobilis]|uniref:DNA 3'-5' helicase n=1 Tax=Adhaeretor mobilis TaxID=1930276 RepID=A0A517MVY8_9BACT|nr:UvrD-helicase domain-containing protein [Adhaeretor mobilis]QDS98957.1 ATP-dependent DNA helicase PcrA [Adhaeretor mobilis]